MLGVFTRMIHQSERRSMLSWLGELISVGFWGGLSGWMIAYYTNLDTPMVAALSAMLGHMGHRGLIFFVRRLISGQIGM